MSEPGESPAERASAVMKRGLARLAENTPDSLRGAVECFDEALAIRRDLPREADGWTGYVLAASWMNRGDALTRLGTAENLCAAVASYDAAIEVMQGVPLGENSRYPRRLAVAWLNRGITLQEQGTPESLAAARASFEQGIAELRGLPEEAVLAASGWMNRGNVLLRLEPPEYGEARVSAETALALVSVHAERDLVAAEIALKARCIVGQALAEVLAAPDREASEAVAAAMRAVEGGLELARSWEQRGETRFRSLSSCLFRFGALVQQRYQPQTLAQFLRSREEAGDLGEDPERHAAAVEALRRAWTELQGEGFSAVNTPRFDHWLETLRALRVAETRLRELRAKNGGAKG